jgi:hypothetical protein
MLRLPTSAPQLPCRCEKSQRVLFFKFFTDWLAPREVQKHLLYPRDSPFLRRYLRPRQTNEDAWHSVDALAVFRGLKARFVHLYREPISQYISVQIARRSELRGSGAASWHCFDADQSKCQSPRSIPHQDLLDIDLQDAGHFISRARRMFKQASTFNPLVRIKFEDCIENATHCITDTYRALGLPPRSMPILSIRVKSSLDIVRNRDALNRSLHEAGLLADAQHANPAKHRGSRVVKARYAKREALTTGERNSAATSLVQLPLYVAPVLPNWILGSIKAHGLLISYADPQLGELVKEHLAILSTRVLNSTAIEFRDSFRRTIQVVNGIASLRTREGGRIKLCSSTMLCSFSVLAHEATGLQDKADVALHSAGYAVPSSGLTE